jgi:fructokinase
MASQKYTVVGLGELLWDLLPAGKQLGGAPANFAYITSLLGDEGIPASRLGQDDLGAQAISRLNQLGLPTVHIQKDADHPTGTVNVEVDSAGQPRFEILEGVAWDFLEWTPLWQTLAQKADAVCFGSLAQRSPKTRATICSFVRATRPDAVRVFDVNLRQEFYSAEVLAESMQLATIVKLNHEELSRIMGLFELEHRGEEPSARQLAALYNLKLVCITRGDGGSLLANASGCSVHQGFQVKVADTVGAGDAFTAALIHEYLRGVPLERMNDVANRVGSWVASQVGATPAPSAGGMEEILGSRRSA